MTPAVPRCVFLIHFLLGFMHTSSREHSYLAHSPQPRYVSTTHAHPRPSYVLPLAAQAPARALYKEVRDQRSVATPHTAFIAFHYFLVFSFFCFPCAPRISYSVCTCLLLGYGPRVHRLNTFSRHNRCTGYGVLVPRTDHRRTGHHT